VAGPHRQDRLTAALRIGTPVGRLLSAIGLGPAGGGPRVGTISDPRARSSIRSEQRTHNPLVAGSSPAGPTNDLPGTTPLALFLSLALLPALSWSLGVFLTMYSTMFRIGRRQWSFWRPAMHSLIV
jgi:hypothetical protein